MPLEWRKGWLNNTPSGGNIIEDPTEEIPGSQHLERKYWVAANRLRSRHAKTAAKMNKWGLNHSAKCPNCQTDPQDIDHLVLHCPVTKLNGGYETIHKCEDDFKAWLDTTDLKV